jgi:predicted PurR-regulated permease PerM
VNPKSLQGAKDQNSVAAITKALISDPSAVLLPSKDFALSIMATIAVIFALDWAQTFVITILLGIFFAYSLNPLVVWLGRVQIGRPFATTMVMMAVVGALTFGTYTLQGQMHNILQQLPEAATKLSARLATIRKDQSVNVQKVETVVRALEKATTATGDTSSNSKVRSSGTDQPAFKFGNLLWTGSMGVAGAAGQVVMVLFLVFFLLLSGDGFKRKIIRISGPTLSSKKVAVRLLHEINESIQRYMLVLLVTNLLVGLLSWAGFQWIGLENSGAWAVAATLLHIVPYFGPMITAAVTGMAAFMQFDSLAMALLVSGVSLAIATIVGIFVTTWMTGKLAKMNAVAIFISLLFWAWIWGVWGMLLSFPIIVVIRVISQHVERLKPVAELLGDT